MSEKESDLGAGSDSGVANSPLFSHEADVHPLAEVVRHINRLHLLVASELAPPEDGDVEAHVAYWSSALGLSRSDVSRYMDIGHMLARLPLVADECERRGHLPMSHLAMLGRHTRPVADVSLEVVDRELLGVVKPKVDGEVLRGVRAVAIRVQRVLDDCAPEARPRDVDVVGPEADRALAGQVRAAVAAVEDFEGSVGSDAEALRASAADYFGDRMSVRESFSVDDRDSTGMTVLTAVLERHHAVEALAVVDAVAAEMKCGRAKALMHALRGACDVEVNLDLLRVLQPDADGSPVETPVWLKGAGWLSPLASEVWMRRVSSLRVLGESEVEGYRPSPSQRAFVQARDGVCSFPGCDVPAEKCDIDHIVEFEHRNGDEEAGQPTQAGSTGTENLHCLCRRHHNLKTAGLYRVVRRDDGVEEWTMLSRDEGPFARSDKAHTGHGRYTFESQTVKKRQALADHNRKRKKVHEALRELVKKSRLKNVGEACGEDATGGAGDTGDAGDANAPPF